MEDEQIVELITKQMKGEASDEEIKLLDNWYNQFASNPSLTPSLTSAELEGLSKKMFLVISEAIETAPDPDVVKANIYKNHTS